MRYKVISIEIEDGIITAQSWGDTKTIKGFLTPRGISESFAVKGWTFDRIWLDSGNEENGSGWAFVAKY